MSTAQDTGAWMNATSLARIAEVEDRLAGLDADGVERLINDAIDGNRRIHELDCVNLNPATNVMNPRAEAALASGLGSRPSLGHPGDKYEMGLESIEEIEIAAAALARQVFGTRFAEIRVGSGALANLYAFMATCQPGDTVIVPPASIAGHVTHHAAGCAGLYGLTIVEAPVDAARYTVDLAGLAELVEQLSPALVTIGGSLNLLPHPVEEIASIAHGGGARVLFDAAHQCGLIAGRAWPCPIKAGADIMTMSTYKSLGGPAGGLIVSDDAAIMERLDAIAYPGLTANFDVSKSAALAIGLLDWIEHGQAYATAMVDTAAALTEELIDLGLPVFRTEAGATTSHQFAIDAAGWGGGQAASHLLRRANILACGIGLPIPEISGDVNGLRFGTPEIVRWGMGPTDMEELASLIDRGFDAPDETALAVTEFRRQFSSLHHVRT